MLQAIFDDKFLSKLKAGNYNRQLYPSVRDRKFWDKIANGEIHQEWKKSLCLEADRLLHVEIPVTRLSDYMRFTLDGDRDQYEISYFTKRDQLGYLSLAYLLTNDKKYFNGIINRIWSILEETFWTVPAHAIYANNDPIPDLTTTGKVDLFAAATARQLSECYLLFKEDMEDISPNLVRQLKRSVTDRAVYPVMAGRALDHSWLNGRGNWSVWCASNILAAGIALLDEPRECAVLLKQLNETVDKFIGFYPADGYCDEGPMYWRVAGGRLYLYAETLDSAFPGKLDKFYRNAKIRNIGEYISKVYLTGNYTLCYADCDGRIIPHEGLLYRIGERIGCDKLKVMAVDFAKQNIGTLKDFPPVCGETLAHGLLQFCAIPAKLPKVAPFAEPPVTHFVDGGMVILRGGDFVTTLKAGHNNEAHNHLDLGQWSLYHAGKPVVIDLGTEIYTKNHFNDQRYTIWTTNALGHNGPVLDNICQQPGAEFTAKLTDVKPNQAKVDLAKAYPAKLGLKKLIRQVNIDGKTFTVSDTLDQEREVEIHLYLPEAVAKAGAAKFKAGAPAVTLEGLKVKSCQKVPLADRRLKASWGDEIFHLVLSGKTAKYSIIFNG